MQHVRILALTLLLLSITVVGCFAQAQQDVDALLSVDNWDLVEQRIDTTSGYVWQDFVHVDGDSVGVAQRTLNPTSGTVRAVVVHHSDSTFVWGLNLFTEPLAVSHDPIDMFWTLIGWGDPHHSMHTVGTEVKRTRERGIPIE